MKYYLSFDFMAAAKHSINKLVNPSLSCPFDIYRRFTAGKPIGRELFSYVRKYCSIA